MGSFTPTLAAPVENFPKHGSCCLKFSSIPRNRHHSCHGALPGDLPLSPVCADGSCSSCITTVIVAVIIANHQHHSDPAKTYILRGTPRTYAIETRAVTDNQTSESVKCRFSKCFFSVLNLKFDCISDGGCTREKQIQKALGSLQPCGNRCRFSESAICSSRVHPPSEIQSNFKFKTLRWRPLRWRLTLSEDS